jgi:hypothetical protein
MEREIILMNHPMTCDVNYNLDDELRVLINKYLGVFGTRLPVVN